MISVRKSEERGRADHGWLLSRHTFSFANYFDREHMGFRTLRVINEDRVQPNRGFETHAHQDMEILSYVVEGALEHRDDLGTGSVIRPGDVQRMSAGRGITHSEFNHSASDPLHFLQIWILPEREGLDASYEQKHFDRSSRENILRLVASRDGRDDSVVVHQDVNVFAGLLAAGRSLTFELHPQRYAWVQLVGGAVEVNGVPLAEGDGAAIAAVERCEFEVLMHAELLIFDLA